MLEVKNVDIMISTRYLIKSLSFTLNKKDKLAIIGEEGNGKSTLLKSLLGMCNYATITGLVKFNGNTIGYLGQSLCEGNLNKKVYDFLFKDEKDYYNKINAFYKYLENLKINDSILEQTINILSGGEKVKQILNQIVKFVKVWNKTFFNGNIIV